MEKFSSVFARDYARKQLFSLLSLALVDKRVATKSGENCLSENPQEPNVNVVRSVWRRLKKNLKEAIIRDLQPREDVKGGGGVKGESKSTRDGTGTTHGH